jgi:hypothetical protein
MDRQLAPLYSPKGEGEATGMAMGMGMGMGTGTGTGTGTSANGLQMLLDAGMRREREEID